MESYRICYFVTVLFHLAKCPPVSSRLFLYDRIFLPDLCWSAIGRHFCPFSHLEGKTHNWICCFLCVCVCVFSFPLSPKQLNQPTQSQKRVMSLTVLRMTDQHGKMTPEKGSVDLDLGVSKRYWLPEKSVCSLERRSRNLQLWGGIKSCRIIFKLCFLF